MPNASTVPASEKQLHWIAKLVNTKQIPEDKRAEIKLALKRMEITKHLGSQYLDLLFHATDIPVEGAVTEPGFYLNQGKVFKVQASKSDNLYAKLVTANGFAYAAGAVKALRSYQKMTVEQICEYGLQTSVCVNCSTPFSDPISKFIGLGPTCGPKLMGKTAYNEAKKAAKADPTTAMALAHKEALKNAS